MHVPYPTLAILVALRFVFAAACYWILEQLCDNIFYWWIALVAGGVILFYGESSLVTYFNLPRFF